MVDLITFISHSNAWISQIKKQNTKNKETRSTRNLKFDIEVLPWEIYLLQKELQFCIPSKCLARARQPDLGHGRPPPSSRFDPFSRIHVIRGRRSRRISDPPCLTPFIFLIHFCE